MTQEAKTDPEEMEGVRTIAKAMLKAWDSGRDGDDVFAEYGDRLEKAIGKASLVKPINPY